MRRIWASRLSWSEVTSIFRTLWDSVTQAIEHAVVQGLAHRDLSELAAIGVDEVAWSRGAKVFDARLRHQRGDRRLLAMAEE